MLSMKVITNPDIDPMGVGVWAVVAEWYGCPRVIHTGTILECARYVAREG